VIEHDGKTVAFPQADAEFKWNPEQDPGSQLFVVFARGFEVPVMDGQP
jgi:hypothetical protein